jgi:hypothetical protein
MRTSLIYAPANVNGVNAPAFPRPTVVAGHPPAKDAIDENLWDVYYCGDKTTGVAAPSLPTSNRTAPIAGNRAVIAALKKDTADLKDVLERISAVKAELQHAAVKADVGVHLRCFKVEIVPED